MFDAKTYEPAGPVMKAFHESSAFYRALAGPIGSSKTTGAAVAEALFGAMVQRPGPDGIRRFKLGVLRDTYRNLYATTMKSWNYWWPRELGNFTGSDDRPAYHRFQAETPIGLCEVEAEFRALGASQDVEATCRGWELNGAYIDEADLVPESAVTYLSGRVQRAGDAKLRQSKGVWFTFNKPDTDHYLYRWCEEKGFEAPEGLAEEIAKFGFSPLFEYFNQPGGLLPGLPLRTNPKAENLGNLDAGYYLISAAGQPQDYIRRMIRNEWGASVAGERVYQTFQPDLHVLPADLDPQPGQILRLGLDGGGTPAAVIFGRDEYGRRIVYDEVVITDPNDPKGLTLKTGVGPNTFGKAIAAVMSLPRYRGVRFEIGYGDPAAFYGADREAGEFSFMETVAQIIGVPIIPADSNEIGLRHDAVAGLLGELAQDGRPMLMVNPRCRWLRRGFTSDYKWGVVKPGQEGARVVPQKSKTSHVHDALQYGCLGDVGRAGVTAGRRFDKATPRPQTPVQQLSSMFPDGRLQAVVPGTHYKTDYKLW
jgi:hypothetical protein